MALLWVLNYGDGRHTLLDIASRSGIMFASIRQAAGALLAEGLLAPASGGFGLGPDAGGRE
jgi:aminopeptidase-like protein